MILEQSQFIQRSGHQRGIAHSIANWRIELVRKLTASQIAQSIAKRAWSRTDVTPPYRVVQGRLEAKEEAQDSRLLIVVDGVRVSVDAATFEMLSVGECVRVLYTRKVRAISIDRYASAGDSLAGDE